MSSKDFVHELGYLGCEEIVHRDNICLLQRPHSSLSDANLDISGAQPASSAPPNRDVSKQSNGHGSSAEGVDHLSAVVM